MNRYFCSATNPLCQVLLSISWLSWLTNQMLRPMSLIESQRVWGDALKQIETREGCSSWIWAFHKLYQVPSTKYLRYLRYKTRCSMPYDEVYGQGGETNWEDEGRLGRSCTVYTSGLKCQLHLTQTQLTPAAHAAFLSSSVSSKNSKV